MLMIDDYEDYCEVWPEPITTPEDELRNCSTFAISVDLSFIHPPSDSSYQRDDLDQDDNDNDDDYDEELEFLNGLEETPVEVRSFEVERDRLINLDDSNNGNSKSTLEEILVFMHIPFKPFMVDKILACAREMVKNYQNHKVLRIHARISVVVFDDEVGLSAESLDGSDTSMVEMVPASESAVAELETVSVDEESSKRCTICLEELLLGSQGTRMPCSHLFHGGCILNWLKHSRFCPLCRFEMN